MITTKQSADLARAIGKYTKACTAAEWVGSGSPEDADKLRKRVLQTNIRLNTLIGGLITAEIPVEKTFATDEQIQAARQCYAEGTDDIEIDDFNVQTSVGEDGVWVQAWVWLPKHESD